MSRSNLVSQLVVSLATPFDSKNKLSPLLWSISKSWYVSSHIQPRSSVMQLTVKSYIETNVN